MFIGENVILSITGNFCRW